MTVLLRYSVSRPMTYSAIHSFTIRIYDGAHTTQLVI
jgi:hypothetical protein